MKKASYNRICLVHITLLYNLVLYTHFHNTMYFTLSGLLKSIIDSRKKKQKKRCPLLLLQDCNSPTNASISRKLLQMYSFLTA